MQTEADACAALTKGCPTIAQDLQADKNTHAAITSGLNGEQWHAQPRVRETMFFVQRRGPHLSRDWPASQELPHQKGDSKGEKQAGVGKEGGTIASKAFSTYEAVRDHDTGISQGTDRELDETDDDFTLFEAYASLPQHRPSQCTTWNRCGHLRIVVHIA